MPETINNSASTTYTLTGSSDPQTATSNQLGISFDNAQGLSLTKVANPTEFVNGDIIAYTVTITNNSGSFLNGVRIIDNLSGNQLAYVLGSASLTTSSQTYLVTPVATNPLTFTLQQLGVGQTMTLTYRAQVIFNLPSTVTSLNNTVQGIGYTATGTVNGFANATILKKNSASFSINKSANAVSVVPNQPFNYFLTLTNNNSVVANVSSIVDTLPSNYTLTSVRLQIGNGSPVTLSSSDYTLDGSNTITIPSGTGPTITVPANGVTVVTLTGHFN